MKQVIDIEFLKSTGHVLTAVTRIGKALAPPPAEPADGLFRFVVSTGKDTAELVFDIDRVKVARLTLELGQVEAEMLFSRAMYYIANDQLEQGNQDLGASRDAAGLVTITTAVLRTESAPFVLLTTPESGKPPVARIDELPPSPKAYKVLEQLFPKTKYAALALFVRGYPMRVIT